MNKLMAITTPPDSHLPVKSPVPEPVPKPTPEDVPIAKQFKIGRHGKLHPPVQDYVCEMIRTGIPERYIPQAIGIHRDTWYLWLRRGKEAKSGRYRDFYLAVEEARKDAVQVYVENLKEAATTVRKTREIKIITSEDGSTKKIQTIHEHLPDVRAITYFLSRRVEEFRLTMDVNQNIETTSLPTVIDYGPEDIETIDVTDADADEP